jgi:small-conductance mechanosensitive channel
VSICAFIGAGVFGVAVALIANVPVLGFIWFVRWLSGLPRKRNPKDVGLDEAYTILLAWIVAKLASNWQRRSLDKIGPKLEREIRVQSLIALVAGTLSVAIGAVAGVFARSHPEWWSWNVGWC